MMATRTARMTSLLQTSLKTVHLELINESHMHNVPKEAETHFKVIVVSPEFEGVPLVKRHQKIHEVLLNELNTGLHALSIVAKTQPEWEKINKIEPSPKCAGGFGK